MREILFRGKPKEQENFYFFSQCWKENCKDGFIYGSLVVDKDRYFISVAALCSNRSNINNGITSMIEVIPETVGQYIGETDKNGKKVFEGDIVCQVSYAKHIHCIDFECSSFCYWSSDYKYRVPIEDNEYGLLISACKVIGNIHDNPELMKGA